MADEIELLTFTAADTGIADWSIINKNNIRIAAAINEHAEELLSLARQQTATINFGIEHEGNTIILSGHNHLRSKITNAYVLLGDNLTKEIDIKIEGITNTVSFSSTEKAGKMKLMTIHKEEILSYEDIVVITSSDRRIMVHVTLESKEGV